VLDDYLLIGEREGLKQVRTERVFCAARRRGAHRCADRR